MNLWNTSTGGTAAGSGGSGKSAYERGEYD